MKATHVSLVLIDSHCILCDGLSRLLDSIDDFTVLGTFHTPQAASDFLQSAKVDVVITGLLFEDADVLRFITDWSNDYPLMKAIVLSQFPEDVYAERVLSAGAAGYLMKDAQADLLIDAVRKVSRGEVAISSAMSSRLLSNFSRWRSENTTGDLSSLSDRELLVFTLIGQGHATARIAETMGVSKKTVSTFKERIKVKLSLTNSLQLTQIAMQRFGKSI